MLTANISSDPKDYKAFEKLITLKMTLASQQIDRKHISWLVL